MSSTHTHQDGELHNIRNLPRLCRSHGEYLPCFAWKMPYHHRREGLEAYAFLSVTLRPFYFPLLHRFVHIHLRWRTFSFCPLLNRVFHSQRAGHCFVLHKIQCLPYVYQLPRSAGPIDWHCHATRRPFLLCNSHRSPLYGSKNSVVLMVLYHC